MEIKNNMKKKEDKKNDDEIVFEEGLDFKKKSSFGKSDSKLKNRIKELEKEKKEYLDGWQRTQADIINIKKQHGEEKKLFVQIGKQSLLEEIIPVLDNFDAAFSNKEAWEKTPEEWRIGVEYIYNQFLEILSNNNVEQFGEIGDSFNELSHLSLGNTETDNKDDVDKISIILQKGYSINGKILREAKVKVFI